MQLQFSTLLTTPDASLWQSPLLPARFWVKVNPAGPMPEHCLEIGQCWVWTGACNSDGYGQFKAASRMAGAHRHLYAALLAPLPDGLHVCHRCDNPPCVRPGHLFTGTPADNAADRERKGRNNPPRGERHGRYTHPEQTARGEGHGSAKLNTTKVLEIRRLASEGLTKAAIARQFGVSQALVGYIIRREIWAHV
jgi:hypothetical protein